ncbi:G5 domain-containing protein [Peptoniphilus phoceensis]|uniref:G5 domain-containing protein n=1 Tax=Peptoniphilus phoceensis TaxID=1720298 RepID=UPI00093E8845|nr:G5 domain-containing protein [Peptoniphilus phoceensis]
MKNPIKNGKEVFAVLSVATIMSLSMSVKADAASESKKDLAAENAYTQTIINDIRTRRYTALAESSQELKATDFIGLGNELELGDEIIPTALRAPQEATDPNYLKDEQNVGFYKDTQLERGNGPAFSIPNEPSMDYLDGFRYTTLEPSATSKSKTLWGIEMEFDREQGQRTYTNFGFTNSGLMGAYLDAGIISANDVGVKIAEDEGFKEANYKAESDINITASRAQRNLNLYATVEDLKHINSIENKNTTIGWKSDYSKDASSQKLKATQGTGNVTFDITVNPWPNENDQLDLIYLNGDYDKKVFVKGQTIETGIKVENLDANARERLVGQVYHPVSGEVVPGAEAYIDENDMVVVKMPEGALKTDANGKTIVNNESIFSKTGYKNIQSLDIKFFARPRTEAEFRAIGEEANYGADNYTPTGAGTETINHKGNDVVIDKQGIPRYDHYNKVGEFKLNLDDTMYYDQRFEDGNGDDTTQVDISDVQPGKPFAVKIVQPANPGKTDKSAKDMNDAQDRGEASGELNLTLFDKENKGKAPEDQWKIDVEGNDISKFTITPPESAKAGDSVAVAVKYTYTNGSTDLHWFHFVVQESNHIIPEYETQVNFPSRKQTSPATWTEDGKRIPPSKFTLPDTLETDGEGNKLITDDIGNKWTVTIDETTGEVTAQPVKPEDFNGGEKLTVRVIAHYVDEQKPGEDITEDVNAYFVIKEKANMTARYNAKAGRSGDVLSSDIILNEEDTYNRRPTKFTLDYDTFVDDKGNTWNVSIDENTGTVTATVPNPQEGQSIDGALLNVPVTAHYYEMEDGQQVSMGTRQTEVQFVASGTDGTYVKTEEIPFETKVEKDPKLAKGEIKVITEGKLGSKEVTYVIKDSQIDEEKTTEKILEEPQERLIHVGEGTEDGEHKIEEKVEVPFEVEIQFDDTLKPGEQVVFQEGIPGEKTRTTTITIQDGNVTNTQVGEYTETKAPQKKIIKVGANTEGKVVHEEKIPFKYEISYDPNLESGEYVIDVPGTEGTKKTTWTIKNSKVVGEPEVETTDPVNAVIRVGKKDFTGTLETKKTKAIEFDTEYRVNNELKPGEVREIQKGELGEEETTVTHTIVNGEVTESIEGETKQTKAPVKRIVEVGPGTTDGTYEKIEEIPFETKVEKDPTLKKGEIKVITEGEKGSKKVTYTIKDSKVDETKTKEEVIKEAKDRVIHVGEGVNDGTHTITEEVDVPFETKIEFDDSLKPGEQKVTQEGEPGKKSRDITLTIQDGKVTNTEEGEFTQTKAPKDKIIKVGRNTDGEVKHVEEIPFGYKVEEVEDLKKGEYRIVKPGKVGTKTTTWTIENSKVVGEPTEEIVEAEDALIQVGKGTNDGTHDIVEKKEIPFETRYEYDDSLEPGEEKVVTPGSPGEQERTNKLVIKDGKVVEVQEGEFKTTKDPQERLIKIGRKPTDGEYTKTIEREIPYETKVIYDDTLEAGFQKIEKEGKPGKEEVTITQKIKDSKPVGDPTETTKTITEKEDRIVRVGVKPVVKETELGHDTEYRYNPNLKEGEEKVIEEGSNGKVEYTITFNKEKGKIEVSEKITEPTNKIVEIGYKTDGKVKVESEIPFEVEIIEDPEMEAGKTETVQEGELGKKETTITVVNSEEVSRKEDIIKEPIKKIIKVGTKNVCEIPPVDPEDPDKPVDPTDPKDPTDPTDPTDPEKPEKPGHEDPKDDDKPGHEDHERPHKPNRPSYPDDNTPWKPREEDPKNPPLISYEKPKVEIEVKKDDKDPEVKENEEVKVPENEELKETEENKALDEDQQDQIEETEEANYVSDNDDEREVAKKDRAPKTGDAGITLETASVGIASALLLLLRRFKRKKDDE